MPSSWVLRCAIVFQDLWVSGHRCGPGEHSDISSLISFSVTWSFCYSSCVVFLTLKLRNLPGLPGSSPLPSSILDSGVCSAQENVLLGFGSFLYRIYQHTVSSQDYLPFWVSQTCPPAAEALGRAVKLGHHGNKTGSLPPAYRVLKPRRLHWLWLVAPAFPSPGTFHPALSPTSSFVPFTSGLNVIQSSKSKPASRPCFLLWLSSPVTSYYFIEVFISVCFPSRVRLP